MLKRYIPGLEGIEDPAARTAAAHKFLAEAFNVATEEAKTGLGPLQQLGMQVGDVGESFGKIITEKMNPFIQAMSGSCADRR
ncbi:MAG: hypothetical protein U5O39_03415 [Gammaproteobacteria bacterium]|nr:hypothetical protein [Gammaproteobacteria bacterium]